MHEVIKEVKASHLGYIQEKLEALVASVVKTSNKENVFGETDSGVFNGKKQLRIKIRTNDLKVWNEIIHELIKINETAIKDHPIGYQNNQSVRFGEDKETRFYTITLNTETSSLYYGFAYRVKY